MIPDRIKLGVDFCPRSLQADLACLDESDWIDNFVTRNFEGQSRILPLRGPQGAEHPIRMAYSDPTCTSFEDTPFLRKCSYFRSVIESFPFEVYSGRLMSLEPGSRIIEHSDYNLAFEDGAVRLHVPIRTNRQMEFFVNQSRVTMNEGECWYLRLSDPHSAYNGGNESRVHMVIDAPVVPAVARFLGVDSANRLPDG